MEFFHESGIPPPLRRIVFDFLGEDTIDTLRVIKLVIAGDSHPRDILIAAAGAGWIEVFAALYKTPRAFSATAGIASGGDPLKVKRQCLCAAASGGQVEILRLLIGGVTPDKEFICDALENAARCGRTAAVRLLIGTLSYQLGPSCYLDLIRIIGPFAAIAAEQGHIDTIDYIAGYLAGVVDLLGTAGARGAMLACFAEVIIHALRFGHPNAVDVMSERFGFMPQPVVINTCATEIVILPERVDMLVYLKKWGGELPARHVWESAAIFGGLGMLREMHRLWGAPRDLESLIQNAEQGCDADTVQLLLSWR